MKLKTMKDLRIGCPSCLGEFIDYNKLKQEAIKWVKDIDMQLKELEQYQGQVIRNTIADKIQGLIATRMWIINFFNIIEDELLK